MLLVTGATGKVGGETLRQLVAKGIPVRALVHSPAKADSLRGAGYDVAVGALEDRAAMLAALAGVERALLLSAFAPGQLRQETTFIDAAREAGVQHVVKLSALGASADSAMTAGRDHWQSERYLGQSGLAYTILQPNGFMQNFLMNDVHTIAAQGAIYGAVADGKIAFIDVRDIGAVAVQTLTGEGHNGKTYVLTGPEALSYGDVARIFSQVLGKDVRYVDLPVEQLQQGMRGAGVPEFVVENLTALFEIYRRGYGAVVSGEVQAVTGQPPRTFEQFVRDNAAAFAGKTASSPS